MEINLINTDEIIKIQRWIMFDSKGEKEKQEVCFSNTKTKSNNMM